MNKNMSFGDVSKQDILCSYSYFCIEKLHNHRNYRKRGAMHFYFKTTPVNLNPISIILSLFNPEMNCRKTAI